MTEDKKSLESEDTSKVVTVVQCECRRPKKVGVTSYLSFMHILYNILEYVSPDSIIVLKAYISAILQSLFG